MTAAECEACKREAMTGMAAMEAARTAAAVEEAMAAVGAGVKAWQGRDSEVQAASGGGGGGGTVATATVVQTCVREVKQALIAACGRKRSSDPDLWTMPVRSCLRRTLTGMQVA